MNTHDKIELPPLPEGEDSSFGPYSVYTEEQMHTYAIAAIEADRKTFSKQLAAYKWLTESLEKRLALLQAQHDELKKVNNPKLLASERAANAILTAELEADRKRSGEQEACNECGGDGAGGAHEDDCKYAPQQAGEHGASPTQVLITMGKVIAGYRPGGKGWSEYDQQVYDVAMSVSQLQQTPVKDIPEGFRLIAVNEKFDSLMFWLDRCEQKGHLENCPDLVGPWEEFEYREFVTEL